MGNTLQEIVNVATAVEAFEPILQAFVPGSTPFIPLFNAAVAGVNVASQDISAANKSIPQIVDDVILGLERGLGLVPGTLANAPSLSAGTTAGT